MGARGSKSKDNAVVDDPHRQPPVDRMTETQLHEFKEAFSQFDADRSGFIDAHELKNLCQWVGQDATEEEIQIMLDTGGWHCLPCYRFRSIVALALRYCLCFPTWLLTLVPAQTAVTAALLAAAFCSARWAA